MVCQGGAGVWAAGSLWTVNEGCVGAQLAPGRAEAASRES